jgi:hypothetical protein
MRSINGANVCSSIFRRSGRDALSALALQILKFLAALKDNPTALIEQGETIMGVVRGKSPYYRRDLR